MKYSVCVDALFWGLDFIEAMKTVKECGIDSIEFWGWDSKDIGTICKAKDALGMKIIGCCTKEFNLVDPEKRSAYIDGLSASISVANKLGASCLITQVGDDTGAPRSEQKQSIIDGLRSCVPILKETGITLLVEPLNTLVDHKGYFLSSSEEAFDIIKAVGSDHVKVLFDIYHQQITEGNLINNIKENIKLIGHFHAAGNPGRNELNKGEINYQNIFAEIQKLEYDGYAGLEFFPTADAKEAIKASCHSTTP